MNEYQSFIIGVGSVCALVGAMQFGWNQAMTFSRKLERHGVSLKAWQEDREDATVNSSPRLVTRP